MEHSEKSSGSGICELEEKQPELYITVEKALRLPSIQYKLSENCAYDHLAKGNRKRNVQTGLVIRFGAMCVICKGEVSLDRTTRFRERPFENRQLPSRLMFAVDWKSGMHFSVDTGAQVSFIPVSFQPTSVPPALTLQALDIPHRLLAADTLSWI